MITVALLLLPALGVLLFGLDQVEDRWVTRPTGARHARRWPFFRRPRLRVSHRR
ncbi:hypothetical protein ACF1GY_29040 [Streptomyces sp. NPDC014684]|uniref:hypothetical protein n=1 Tax=Streptomyces sp. NPDC014684 TaxID=3364880 RepID=UPI0037009D2B